MPTPFRALAELGEKLECTTKRLLMIDTVAIFLAKLEPNEIEPAVSMILGRPLPKWDPRSLDVSWASLSEMIRRITSIDWKLFSEAFGETGDIGLRPRWCLKETGCGSRRRFLKNP